MKDRPILFSADMIKAILEGRKTETRRIVKKIALEAILNGDRDTMTFQNEYGDSLPITNLCRYGKPGDQLWVREAWCEHWIHNGEEWIESGYRYKATDEKDPRAKWRPSIHMPRSASRITLEIVSIRVEKLRDISVTDCLKEGIHPCRPTDDFGKEITMFSNLWDSINRTHPWSSNPWVWVVEFRRII